MRKSKLFTLPLALCLVVMALVSGTAHGIEPPSSQVHIQSQKILRGSFTHEHHSGSSNQIISTSGHFTVAPAYGLIWGIEQPFPTTTVITPYGAIQDIGGLVLKWSAKNLRQLYDMVGGALAGDWSALEKDFIIVKKEDNQFWQMSLSPRNKDSSKLQFTSVTVSGGSFVEKIVLTEADGSSDMLLFSDEIVDTNPLATKEVALFKKVK